MMDKNLKNLIEKLQYKSRPAVKERMREKIDRAWNQQTFTQEPRQVLPLWRIIMNSPKTKFAIAAVLILAVVLGVIPFLKHTAPPTFAQIVSPMMQAQTAKLTIVVGPPGQAPEIQDMIMGNRIRRIVQGAQENVIIIDLETSKIMTLDPRTKTVVYVDLKNLPKIPNYLEHLRNLITVLEESEKTEIEYLEEHDLDGRRVLGYKVAYPNGVLYLWADPVTYAPVQIEQYEGQLTIICKDLQFDVPMDEAMFSTEVPEGYTIQQTQLDLASGTEENFIEGLRLWAEYVGDGFFPEDVHVEAFIKNAPYMGQKLEAAGLSDEEAMKIGMALSRHALFIRFFPGEGDWVYNGKDVQYGDAEIPVFWYKPRGPETWRVIYGDLRMEDVAEENLPTVMTDEERAANKQRYPAPEVATFIGTEKAIWHFQPGGRIEVHSELTISARPENAGVLPVRLPYPEGTLEQVLSGQTNLAFEAGDEADKYTIALPAEPLDELVCIWSLPLDAVDIKDGDYQVRLKSVIPVTDFKLEVVLEPGCGLVATFTTETNFAPFKGKSDNAKDNFGIWHGLTKAQ